MTEFDGIRNIRPGEELDGAALRNYLGGIMPEWAEGRLDVKQFTSGHSNLTYLVRAESGQEMVLRRPPLGPVAARAHDMTREFGVLSAVHPVFSLAPRPLHLCEDVSVIGAPFYLMERMRGVTLDRLWPTQYPDTPQAARDISQAAVETLAKIHAVDVLDGVAALGHPEGYLRRQVEGWITRHERARTSDDRRSEVIGRQLLDVVPPEGQPTLIHNDFKLNNLLFHHTESNCVTGVVDWEMATVGDPLSDLAIALSYWAQSDDPPALATTLSPLTARAGFYTRAEWARAYSEATGRSVEHLGYYMAFAYFKAAGICQQIYYRYHQGQTADSRFRNLGELATLLLMTASRYLHDESN